MGMIAIIIMLGSGYAVVIRVSPLRTTTLGSTAGLNVDGQHDHIWDTCVPTFLWPFLVL